MMTNNNQPQSFYYGCEVISFTRTYGKSIQPKVKLKVYPDCAVEASAHAAVSNADVLVAVKKRSRWIYCQLKHFRQQLAHVTPRQYVSGESHYYLGRQYMLKVEAIPNGIESIKLTRGKLMVTIAKKDPDLIQARLEHWYRQRAKLIFTQCLDSMLQHAVWVKKKPSLRIFKMKTQWGNCSPNGKLTLNPLLVKTPIECINYVILHELCHLVEHNHSENFYRLMKQVLPSWEKTKLRLDGMAAKLY